MKHAELERWERLISRVLDGEATAAERAELEAAMDLDPRLRDLYETTTALDTRIGEALCEALCPADVEPVPLRVVHPSPHAGRRGVLWRRVLRLGAVAAAACVAWMLASGPQTAGPVGEVAEASWFAPPPEPADTLVDPALFSSIPALRVRGARQGWILVPTEDPAEVLVIQAVRIRERTVPIEMDF